MTRTAVQLGKGSDGELAGLGERASWGRHDDARDGADTALSAVLLSKDAVKESLAAVLPEAVSGPDLGVVAIEAVWSLAARVPGIVVVESWWFRPRDLRFAEAGLRSVGAAHAVEVWCDVPADVARRRFAARARAALHEDARRLTEDWDDWAARAEPLALTPVVTVDTRRPVEPSELARTIRLRLAAPA